MSVNSPEIKIDYNDLFESSLDFLFMMDLNGDILDVNEVAVNTLGYSGNNILSMNITDFIIDEEFDQVSYNKKELIDIGRMSRYNIFKIKKRNGNLIDLESHGVPLRKYGEIYAILGIGHEVTKTDNAEQHVNASETKYRNLFNYSPFHIALFDSKGNLVESNRKIFLKLSEYLNEDFTGKNFLDIIPYFKNTKELRRLFIERFASLRKGIILEPIEFSLITKDEKAFWMYWQSSTVEINNEMHIQVIIQDITANKEAEKKLQDSEEKYRSLFENSPISLIDQDFSDVKRYIDQLKASGINNFKKYFDNKPDEVIKCIAKAKIVDVNRKALELYKVNNQEEFILRMNQFSEDIDNEMTEETILDNKMEILSLISGNTMYESEIVTKTSTGENMALYAKTSIVPGFESTWSKIIVSIIDITDKVNAEHDLKESEQKFRTITEQSFIGVIIEQGFDIKYVNHQFSTILGYTSEELLKWTLPDFYGIIHPDDVDRFKKLIDDKGKGMFDRITNFQFRSFKKTGEIIWVELFSRKIMYKDGSANLAFIMDITEKREAEQKIRESEEKFHMLFNNSTSGIAYHKILYDSSGNPIDYVITDVNHQFEKILLLKKTDVINKLSNEVYKVESPPYLDIYSQVAETQVPKSFEAYFQPMNKYFNVSAISEKKGEFISVFDDITERKNAEHNLKTRSEELSVLNRIITLGNESTNLQEFLERSYEQVLDSVGFDRGGVYLYDPETKHNTLVLHKNVHPDFIDTVKDVDTTQEPFNIIFDKNDPFYIKNFSDYMEGSEELGVYSAAIVPLNSKDKYLGSLNIGSPSYQDLPQNELELLVAIGKQMGIIIQKFEAEKLLRESEEKFRNITEQSFMGIIIFQKRQIMYLNKAMSKIIGYPVEEMLNWSEKDMMKLIDPEDLEMILKRLQSNVEGTMGPFSNTSFRIFNRDGKRRWLEDYTTKIIYQGEPASLIAIVDITQKKEGEQLIIEEIRRLLELQELRKDIITRVSHELKTPMTSIYGSIQILLHLFEKEMSKEALNYINIGHRGCLRLKQLIENLLDVSRLDSKKMELRYNKENIVELIEDCTADMNYLAEKRNLYIQLDLPDELYMNIDKLRFSQVITNSISNAIKNTPPKGRIYITLTVYKNHVDLKIKDTGVGLTQEEKSLLFQKFGKIERYGKDLDVDIEGVGLGLYISKEIVELHGGEIIIESDGRNKGSTFIIRLLK